MANRTATLYIRITTKAGRKPYCKPVYHSKGRLKPQYAMVNGEPEHHANGVYYLRFGTDDGKQKFELVGKDHYVALDKLAKSSVGYGTVNSRSSPRNVLTLDRKAVGSASKRRSGNISRTFSRKEKTQRPSELTRWQLKNFASPAPRIS